MESYSFKMFRVSISLVSLMFTIAFGLETAPVVIQDEGLLDGAVGSHNKVMVKMSKEEFELVVDAASKLGDCLIFFVEDTLSLQDIHSKDENGSPFVHLNEAYMSKKSKFFPRVVEPYNYLKNRFQPFDFNTFYVSSTSTRLRIEESFKFIYVFFQDGTNETRTQKLRRHDAIMQEVYFIVKHIAKGPVVSFYTGKNIRHKEQDMRAHAQPPTTQSVLDQLEANCGNATIKLDAEMLVDDDVPGFLKVNKCKYVAGKDNHWTYHITLEHVMEHEQPSVYKLIFLFTYKNPSKQLNGWKLKQVEYLSSKNEKLRTLPLNITGAWDTLYESQHPLMMTPSANFSNLPILNVENFTIYLDLKPRKPRPSMQKTPIPDDCQKKPRVQETPGGNTTQQPHPHKQPLRQIFGKLNKPKSSIDIWRDIITPYGLFGEEDFPNVFLTEVLATCFFIISILLFILFFGVIMIMSVGTNSNYDNPEQKPLFVPETTAD